MLITRCTGAVLHAHHAAGRLKWRPMSFASLLLRLCLAAALVLTGTGNAIASVRMAFEHAAGHAAPVAAAVRADAGSNHCGSAHSGEQPPAAEPAMHHGADASHCPDDDAGAPPDCCQGGQCDGACLQHPAALPRIWPGTASAGGGMPADMPATALPAPHLPLPKRPPIA